MKWHKKSCFFVLFFCPNIWSVLKKVVILQCQKGQRRGQKPNRNQRQNIALWCNGSTPDSGSVCESSSLSKATLKPIHQPDRFSFYSNDLKYHIYLGSADFDGDDAVTPVMGICMSSEIIRDLDLCIRSDWRGGVLAALMQITLHSCKYP